MKMIIDIKDKTVAFDIQNQGLDPQTETDKVIVDALYSGTILPKGHGRLIDEQALVDIIERMWKNKQITNTKYNTFLEILDYVPTVVEKEINE